MSARLSSVEAIMWRAGQDPTHRLTVGALFLLDHPPEEAELVQRVVAAVDRSPRLRWRPDDPTFTRIRPAWVEDDRAGAKHHVRRAEVPAPGSLRQVLDVVSLLEALPFDPDRSPWDVTLLHGVEGGGAAAYLRAHHVLTDGIGGVRLLRDLFDQDDGPAPARTPPVRGSSDVEVPTLRELGTVTIDLTRLGRPVAAGLAAAREVRPIETAVRSLQQALDLANSVSRQVLVVGGALSPAPVSHSTMSRFDVYSFPNARKVATTLGGSRNDVLVAAAAAALGLYFERSGQRCPKVRVAVPNRQRRNGDMDGNWFVPTRVEVPTSARHPQRSFSAVAERLAQARREPALRFTAAVALTIGRLPNRLLLPALQAQADSVDLAVSSIPGVRGEPSLCGAKVTAAYPFGPRLGTPLNVTAFGTHDGLDVGVALDPGAITDPESFHECFVEAFGRFGPAELTSQSVSPV